MARMVFGRNLRIGDVSGDPNTQVSNVQLSWTSSTAKTGMEIDVGVEAMPSQTSKYTRTWR